jgi:hypothetical protein
MPEPEPLTPGERSAVEAKFPFVIELLDAQSADLRAAQARSEALEVERDELRALVRHMDGCIRRGGPSNYDAGFVLPPEFARPLADALTKGGG